MSAPIVFISHNRVKEGELDGFRRYWREVVRSIEADKPGTLVYDSSTVSFASGPGEDTAATHYPAAAAEHRSKEQGR